MTTVNLINEKHEYVEAVQEQFWIVTYTTDYRKARNYYPEHADQIIQEVRKITNGCVKLKKVS